MTAQALASRAPRSRALPALGFAALAVGLAIAGLVWAKWWPYTERTAGLLGGEGWTATPLIETAVRSESWWSAGWEFTVAYTASVWKALLVALVLAAAVQAFVGSDRMAALLRGRGRHRRGRESLRAALLGLPTMMCTCCTAPVVVGLRRAGASAAAATAFWLANPVLNPAVIVFLLLVGPAEWSLVRLVVGIALVAGGACIAGILADRAAVPVPAAAPVPAPAAVTLPARADRAAAPEGESAPFLPPSPDFLPAAEAPGMGAGTASGTDPAPASAEGSASGAGAAAEGRVPGPLARFGRELARFSLTLIPEYLILVFAVGAVAHLGQWSIADAQWTVLAVLAFVLLGVLLVIPTGGEIPVLLALAAAGAGPWPTGAALMCLSAVSLPSLIMVGRALSWRAASAIAGLVAAAGLLAGALLAV